jgi:hypothetical protein
MPSGPMTRRFMRTIMATILVLVIVTHVEVNANDLATIPYHLSNPDGVRAKFISCVVADIKNCHKLYHTTEVFFEFDLCVFEAFKSCAKDNS